MGSKHTSFPKLQCQTPLKVCPWKCLLARSFLREKKLHPRRYSFCNKPLQRCGDRVIFWSFGNLIACTMTMGSKNTLFPKLKSQTPLKVCPWKRLLARCFLREKKLHPRRYSFCNKPLQRCGDRVIIWSFENLIACTMTMGSKNTLFPKLKSQTPLKVCAWKRPLARSVLREKNSIRGGTRFVTKPFKRAEIV